MIQTKERNFSIDILKFFAVLLITNSHMEKAYADYGMLSTGGAIGDALFFFCSGFTLFLGRTGRFDVWYKRRIRRIYPSVFGFALIASLCFSSTSNMLHVILSGGGMFVSCIMLSYIVLYIVRKYFSEHLNIVFIAACGFVLFWYIFMFDNKEMVWMYKRSIIKWYCYFLFMLLGAILGLKAKTMSQFVMGGKNYLLIISKLFLCVLFFYGIQILGGQYVWVSYLQLTTMIPLMGIIWYFYKLSNTTILQQFFQRRFWNFITITIGGLCLEIYLVQMPILTGKQGRLPFTGYTDDLLPLFPLNVLVLVAIILVLAYITRCVGRLFQQTFDSRDGYDWKSILSLR